MEIPIELTILAPLHNEVATLEELVRRCRAVASQLTDRWEVVLVDDASSDGTTILLEKLADGSRVRGVFLAEQHGQFGAVRAGLRHSRGQAVCVLDGDLQDPPEAIARLWQHLRRAPAEVSAVFGEKAVRDDPLLFRLGETSFHSLQFLFGARGLPRGSSSFAILRAPAAAAVAGAELAGGNLASVLALLGAKAESVDYERDPRVEGGSRLGPLGHVSEALHALHHSGALARIAGWFGLLLLAIAGVLVAKGEPARLPAGVGLAATATCGGLTWHRWQLKKRLGLWRCAATSSALPKPPSADSRRL